MTMKIKSPSFKLLLKTARETKNESLSSRLQKTAFYETGGEYTTSKWRREKGLEFYGGAEGIGIGIGISQSLEALRDEITLEAVKIAGKAIVEVLKLSQRMVPHDTGELKQSGTAILNLGRTTRGGVRALTIAKGNRFWNNDTVTTDLRKLTSKKVREMKNKYIGLTVQYTREGEHGEDVALITHEDLAPYGSFKRPRARMPGTGPKYVEIPFRKIRGSFLSDMKNVPMNVQKSLSRLKKIQTARKKGPYEVNTFYLRKRG